MDRRDFLKKTVTVAGGIAASRLLGETNVLAAGRSISNTDPIMDYATLNNGIRMPILGYGTLRIPVERCAEYVSEAIRKGWRLIDTAKIMRTRQKWVKVSGRAVSTGKNFS